MLPRDRSHLQHCTFRKATSRMSYVILCWAFTTAVTLELNLSIPHDIFDVSTALDAINHNILASRCESDFPIVQRPHAIWLQYHNSTWQADNNKQKPAVGVSLNLRAIVDDPQDSELGKLL